MYKRFYSSSTFNNLLVSSPAPRVTLLTLNRPKALNALNSELVQEIRTALTEANADKNVGAIVITGSEKAFAAGADIKAMQQLNFGSAFDTDFIAPWQDIANFRKPLIAAVNGFALGGGFELALMADIMYVGKTATLGQPEIKLGTIPGAGGTQRLTRLAGKSFAMEAILTGRNFTADEAVKRGLAAAEFEPNQLVDEAVKVASKIAANPPLAVISAKDSVNQAYESTLSAGLKYERGQFYALFGSEDRLEGMTAFVEKRKAEWKGN